MCHCGAQHQWIFLLHRTTTNFLWFSKIPHPLATGTNTFNQSWTGLFVYAFPPFNLIQKTLQIRVQGVEEAFVVVPIWPARMWYHFLREMATEAPILFKLEIDLLSQKLQDRGGLYHQDLRHIRLSAWRLSGRGGAKQTILSPSLRLL